MIKDINILDTDLIVSFDIQNLYPSIPIDERLKIVKDLLEHNPNDNLPNETIMEMLTVCVDCNYFRHEDEFYSFIAGRFTNGKLLKSNIGKHFY